jgi:pyruvate ferredoxin oxidoreductase gamma subunit
VVTANAAADGGIEESRMETQEIRFHGRGGQGAVTSASILATAAISDGRFAQAFPSFGPERRGAPVIAYARIAGAQIRNRTAIREPHFVLVLDPSLLALVKVDAGLRAGGTVILNTTKDEAAVRKLYGFKSRLALVDANGIARAEIGRVITNTVMLGALLKAGDLVAPQTLGEEIRRSLGQLGPRNVKAFERAMAETTICQAGG